MRTLFTKGFITSCSLIALTLILFSCVAFSEPDRELTYKLKASVVKVHVITQNGGHGVGTGVVVAQDTIATNCHVLANSNGVSVSKFGESISPVSLLADWALTPASLNSNTWNWHR